LDGKSLNYFDKENPFRKWLYKIVNGSNKNFERLIVIIIAISSL
jgi:hypothetical protein